MPGTVPFSETELRAAFALVMSDAEASELAADISAANHDSAGTSLTLPEGTLDLLARVSPEVALKVEQFRAERGRAIEVQRERRRRFDSS